MSKENLTKEEISKSGTMKLIFRMEFLHVQSIFSPEDAGIPKAIIEEAVAIADELRSTLKGLMRLQRNKK